MRLTNEDKEKIEYLYKSGVDAVQIRKRLGNVHNVDSLRRHIQRNLKHLKEKHEFEKLRTKEILRKTSFECSKEISTGSFVKQNRSIYKNNEKGDFVVNRKIAPIITFDTPKRVTRKNLLGF